MGYRKSFIENSSPLFADFPHRKESDSKIVAYVLGSPAGKSSHVILSE
jgi:hypothetical protein